MADETELRAEPIGRGRINTVSGVVGTGTKGREVVLQAVPDPGYQFERWVVTKTLPFFVAGLGPYDSPEFACGGSGLGNVDIFFLYKRGNKLFVDDQGEREAPLGYYQLVSAENGYRPDPNTYIEYTGNFIPVAATCPPPRNQAGGGLPTNSDNQF